MFYQIPIIHLGQQNNKIMAVQNGSFIQGRIGNLLYRIVKGRQIISQLPVKGTKKMSEKSINDCDTFGMATSLSSAMRKSISQLLGKNTDMDMVNRLNSGMSKIIKLGRDMKTLDYSFKENSFSSINGFEFNADSPLFPMLPVTVSDYKNDGIIEVNLPEADISREIRFPDKAYECTVQVSLSCFRIWEGLAVAKADTQAVTITRAVPRTADTTLQFKVPDGCLCMVTVVLEYYKFRNGQLILINRKNLQPASILKLFLTPGRYQGKDGRKWVKMIKFNQALTAQAI